MALVFNGNTVTGVVYNGTTVKNVIFNGSYVLSEINLTITANTVNYNLYNVVSAMPEYVAGATTVNLTVNSNVYVGSSNAGVVALSVSGFASGDKVNLVNNGFILGAGGAGNVGSSTTAPGGPGGDAIDFGGDSGITVTNNGTIGGGGGAGGHGIGQVTVNAPNVYGSSSGCGSSGNSGGGGGAGYNEGAAGYQQPGTRSPENGTRTNGGRGGTHNGYTTGGAGGAAGVAGSRGYRIEWCKYYHSSTTCYTNIYNPRCSSYPTYTNCSYYCCGNVYRCIAWFNFYGDYADYFAGGGGGLGANGAAGRNNNTGGAAGAYEVGGGNVTWLVTGTRYGSGG